MNRAFWIAAQVRGKQEFSVAAALREKGYETFVPVYVLVREWSDRRKVCELPLISGYVFTRAVAKGDHGPICTTSGVIKLLGSGRQPAMIDDAEIQRIRIVSTSSLKTEPWAYLKQGTQVRISRGALAGVSGTVIQDNGNTLLILSVEMMQRSVAVHIDRSWVDVNTIGKLHLHQGSAGIAERFQSTAMSYRNFNK